MSKLAHLLEIIVMLQYKPLTSASELSEILGVDKKTIYRYIDSLNEANIPVRTKKGRYGGFHIDEKFCMKPGKLSKNEIEALMMATEILTNENGFYYEFELKNAVSKIMSTELNLNVELQDLKDLEEFKIKNIGCSNKLDKKIAEINFAMQRGKTINIDYYSINKNDITVHKVDSYNLLFSKGSWYMAGYSYFSDRIEIFNLSRINKVEITNEIYMKPSSFSLEEYWDKNITVFREEQKEVKIRFCGKAISTIKKGIWCENQEIEEYEDGSVMLHMYVEDIGEIKKWIMGFGSDAEIIEPQELRTEIMDDIKLLVKKYEKI